MSLQAVFISTCSYSRRRSSYWAKPFKRDERTRHV